MYRRRLLFYYTSISILFLLSCKGKVDYQDKDADMRAVINLALKTAFFHDNLPGVETLLKKDSILITADSIYLKLLPPRYDTINFRIVEQNKVCNVLKSYDSTDLSYLLINKIEKTSDSLYYVSIQNRSCNTFGGGGAIGLYIIKEGKSLKVKDYTSSSIN